MANVQSGKVGQFVGRLCLVDKNSKHAVLLNPGVRCERHAMV